MQHLVFLRFSIEKPDPLVNLAPFVLSCPVCFRLKISMKADKMFHSFSEIRFL